MKSFPFLSKRIIIIVLFLSTSFVGIVSLSQNALARESQLIGNGNIPRIAVNQDGDVFIAYSIPTNVYITPSSSYATKVIAISSSKNGFVPKNLSTINASAGGFYGASNLVLDSQGNPHLAWVETGNVLGQTNRSHLVHWTADKSNLDSASTVLFAENISVSSVIFSPIIRVDSTGKVYVVCYIQEKEGENIVPSILIWNSSNNFNNPINISSPVQSNVTLLGREMISAVIDSHNNIHVIWMTIEAEWWYKPITTKIFHASSADNFNSKTTQKKKKNDSFIEIDKLAAVIDQQDKIYVMLQTPGYGIYKIRDLYQIIRNSDGTIEPLKRFIRGVKNYEANSLENSIGITKDNKLALVIDHDQGDVDTASSQWKYFIENNSTAKAIRPYNFNDRCLVMALQGGETLHIAFEKEGTESDEIPGAEIHYLADPEETDDDIGGFLKIDGFPIYLILALSLYTILKLRKRV